MYNSPFNTQQAATPKPRNYSDVFNPEEYECKASLELESYARNLKNYLLTLLSQDPFPAFLFEKLEKRLDGVSSILQKRSAVSGVLSKDKAKERLHVLSSRLECTDANASEEQTTPPAKRRKLDPPCQEDVIKEMNALRRLKRSYSDSQKTEEEEE